MIRLAVVGAIASGKSTVLGQLRGLGAETSSADELVRQLTAPGQAALGQIIAAFGEAYLQEDGSLDRKRLARLIFESSEARDRLEAILHPAVLRRIDAWLAGLGERDAPPAVAAVEVLRLPRRLRARDLFDVVWLCSASESVRARRLIERDGLPETEAQRRIEVQRSQQIDDCEPDLVLNTEGPVDGLASRVREAWAALIRPSSRPAVALDPSRERAERKP